MLRIIARHKLTFKKVELHYNTISEAKLNNKGYFNFEVIGGTK